MQEEVENRAVALIVSSSKLTGRVLQTAIAKYLEHCKEKKNQRNGPIVHHGKQSVKKLIGQNQGVSNIEVNDPSVREFERIARRYGVDYAVKKDRTCNPPKYLIFFKGRDADALTTVFKEYSSQKLKKSERPSVLETLNHYKEIIKNAVVNRTKRKELER